MSLYILRHQTGIAKYLKRFAKNFAQKSVDCLGNPHISPRTLYVHSILYNVHS
jgi:hypothetical protein